MAIGFLVLSSSHLICSYSVPGYLPFARVYGLCGYYVQRDGMIYEPAQTTAGRVAPRIVGVEGSSLPDFRTSNAVETLLAGAIGSLIGLLAYNRAAKDEWRSE